MSVRLPLAVVGACLLSQSIAASPSVYDEFFRAAAARYQLDASLLMAIAEQESNFDAAAVNINADRSEDRGLMQINSFWWPKLAEYGILPDDLWRPEVNIHVGAWILAENVSRYGYTWDAVGAYNAGTSEKPDRLALRRRYVAQVFPRFVQYSRAEGE